MIWVCSGCDKTFNSREIRGWSLCPICKLKESLDEWQKDNSLTTLSNTYKLRLLVSDMLIAIDWVFKYQKELVK